MADNKGNLASRRVLLRAGLGVVAGTAIARSAAAQAAPKLAKSVVMYQDQPKNGQHCSICANWQPPNSCKIVEGTISPNGWCGAFAPKQA